MLSTTEVNDKGKQASSDADIYFSDRDLDNIMHPHEDPLVISADIGASITIHKVIVDGGSSVDILYYNAFVEMGYKREDLTPQKEAIYGFTNVAAPIAGSITLKASIGRGKLMMFDFCLRSSTHQYPLVLSGPPTQLVRKLLCVVIALYVMLSRQLVVEESRSMLPTLRTRVSVCKVSILSQVDLESYLYC